MSVLKPFVLRGRLWSLQHDSQRSCQQDQVEPGHHRFQLWEFSGEYFKLLTSEWYFRPNRGLLKTYVPETDTSSTVQEKITITLKQNIASGDRVQINTSGSVNWCVSYLEDDV